MTEVFESILSCPSCSNDMVLKKKKDNKGWYISCVGFPSCKTVCWLPSSVLDVKVMGETCQNVISFSIKHEKS